MDTNSRRSGSRYSKILEVAAELFYERSFAAVGVDEIGARAGVSGPAIYRHFKGKDEILATLFNDAIDHLIEMTAGEYDDPYEALEALVRGHTRFVIGARKLAGVKIREERSLADPYRKLLVNREKRYVDRWVDCLQRCYPEHGIDQITTAAHVALGAINSIATWPPEARRTDDLDDVISAVVLGGLESFEGSLGGASRGTGATNAS